MTGEASPPALMDSRHLALSGSLDSTTSQETARGSVKSCRVLATAARALKTPDESRETALCES